MEAAYPWGPVRVSQGSEPFSETSQGQQHFLQAVNRILQATSGNLGKGTPGGSPPLCARGITAAWQPEDFSTRMVTRFPSSPYSMNSREDERLSGYGPERI